MEYLWLLLGLIVLIIGGEFLVRGAVGIATIFKISPLVVGLTVVSFGTSAPELLVSLQSALNGNPGIAIGNVIGSNIANLALVLGVTVLIFPIIAEKQTKVIDFPFMIFATLLFYLFALDNVIALWEGVVFVSILISYTTYLVVNSRKKEKIKLANLDLEISPDENKDTKLMSIIFLLGGFVGLYFGSDWFVSGAIDIAKTFHLSDSVIGVTVVAIGTSAPELVASTMAAMRKQTDISVGNLVGSNIFNVFAVLGITSIAKPIGVSDAVLSFDMYWMLAISLLLVPILYFGSKIGRLKGAILISSYLIYIVVIVFRTMG